MATKIGEWRRQLVTALLKSPSSEEGIAHGPQYVRNDGNCMADSLASKAPTIVSPTRCGRHGFIVAITGIESVGKRLIRDGTGYVTFPVKYQCVVFRLFKGEIVEAVVSMVNKRDE
ncbi:DNA-directed RNA polymerase II subunit RPB7 [Forsythia ovata]|uniref:DNA-directed RNA polymerase subunit n=1 Tax=Forsythia ovata TaxID=205694 RepID=A0ABD1WV15_9LAMI